MIPSPNLDDRTYRDIVDEAIRLIPQYCPEWTNFNPSDPGITLIQLFAWMTEMVIYRLNRVPEKNYLTFLDLMGIQRQPPQPSRTVLTFQLSDKTDMTVVPKGTQVATKPQGDRKSTTFETEQDVVLVTNRIVRAVSQYHDQYADVTPYIDGRQPFEVFEGVTSVDRYVYVGDDRLGSFGEAAILTLRFERPSPGERPFPKLLEWEYWNGERWRELGGAGTEQPFDSEAFLGPAEIAKCRVNDIETFWIRGRLAEVPDKLDETELDRVFGRIEVLGEGVRPGWVYFNPTGDAFLVQDLDRNFKPLGDEPALDNFLYVASEEIFAQPNTRIRIEVQLSDPSVAEKPAASGDLVLEWQYWSGKRWKAFGRCGPGHEAPKGKVAEKDVNPFAFSDETAALTVSGAIAFNRPEDMAACEVNGRPNFWIRCHVAKGGYGQKGSYELIEDRWVYKDEHPLRPPVLKNLSLKFSEADLPFAQVWTYNDFQFSDWTRQAAQEYKPFQAFTAVPEENPTLYLGFEHPLPHEPVQLYFNVLDAASLTTGVRKPRGGLGRQRVFVGTELERFAEQSVVWEYWNGKEWTLLLPKDHTDNFTSSGFVEFVGPKTQRKVRRYGDTLFWIRARLEYGGYDEPPVCDRILLNSVYASNHTTYPETILGSSLGTPNQIYRFPNNPVLPGQRIVVVESDRPTDDEIQTVLAESGPKAFYDFPDGGYVVAWKEVESLYESGQKSRHYTKDITTGEIRFGDGIHGMIPPKGDRCVRALEYKVGGGTTGNVPAGTVDMLKVALSYIDGVANPFPAMGGADLESIDELKLRGPAMLKSRGRAVTKADYEALALQASNSVARVTCIAGYGSEGQVAVVVVPKVSEKHEEALEKPLPTTELLRRVRVYLEERKLLTTKLHVLRPRYRELSVRVEITRRPSGSSDRIKREIDERLRKFLHPLRGWKDKRGWPFGRNVFKVDLYHVVEEVEGVDFVSKVLIFDEEKKVDVEMVRVDEDELPFLVNVDIHEKAPEAIV
jgi:hypothetical protein